MRGKRRCWDHGMFDGPSCVFIESAVIEQACADCHIRANHWPQVLLAILTEHGGARRGGHKNLQQLRRAVSRVFCSLLAVSDRLFHCSKQQVLNSTQDRLGCFVPSVNVLPFSSGTQINTQFQGQQPLVCLRWNSHSPLGCYSFVVLWNFVYSRLRTPPEGFNPWLCPKD